MIAGNTPSSVGPRGPTGKGQEGQDGSEPGQGQGGGDQAGNRLGRNGQGVGRLGNLASLIGPVTSAPQGIVEQFFQPANGRAPSTIGFEGQPPPGTQPLKQLDNVPMGQLSQAAKQLQSAVQRIESGRSRRAKDASQWRDDPRRLQQFKDW